MSSISLQYQRESISIIQGLLSYGDAGNVLFALRGSFEAANSFASEAQLVLNGKPANSDVVPRFDATSCEPDTYVFQVMINLAIVSNEQIEMFIPSVRALWDMELWRS